MDTILVSILDARAKRARRPLLRREPSFNRSQLRKSSSAAQTPQVTEDQQLIDSSAYSSRKLLILRALASWLAALDDFRNWLIREAA